MFQIRSAGHGKLGQQRTQRAGCSHYGTKFPNVIEKKDRKRNALSFADRGTFLAKMAIPHLLVPGTRV